MHTPVNQKLFSFLHTLTCYFFVNFDSIFFIYKMKLKLALLFLILGFNLVSAQRTVLLEHFTQASCGPCAAQNPALKAVLDANADKIVAIKYQTRWPGVDPMNEDNRADPEARVNYYNVTGVPHSVVDGNVYRGAPRGVTTNLINNRYNAPTPITINLSHRITFTDSIYVTAVVNTSTPVSGDLRLHIVVIEKEIIFATPPGTNGEKEFYSVCKKMLPTNDGTKITSLMPDSAKTIEVKWKLAKIYNLANVAVVAFLQNQATKEVWQAAISEPNLPFRLSLTASNTVPSARLVDKNDPVEFKLNFASTADTTEDYRFILSKGTLPAGWKAEIVLDGTAAPDSVAELKAAAANLNQEVTVRVTPSNTVGKAILKLTGLSSSQYPNYKVSGEVVLARAGDNLLVNFGDASISTLYRGLFNRLTAKKTYAELTGAEFARIPATDLTVTTAPRLIVTTLNAYGNLFSRDMIAQFENYIKAGGRAFFAGQDLAWYGGNPDLPEPDFNYFLQSYLGANYLEDYHTKNNLMAVADDDFFKSVGAIVLTTTGGQRYFSDVVEAIGTGKGIFYYGNTKDSLGGVRNEGIAKTAATNWRTVYLSFIWEQIADANKRNMLWNKIIEFLDNEITGVEFDKAIAELNIGAYPNPATIQTEIRFTGLKNSFELSVVDINGREIVRESLPANTERYLLNTTGFTPGMYFYRISENGKLISSQKLIIH
jgi:hypothetical protein